VRVGELEVGVRIRIKTGFRDFDGQPCEAGRELVLVAHERFPYDDGHTLRFADGTVIRLAGIEPANRVVLDDRSDAYWEIVR
jgi:hypothetical protein